MAERALLGGAVAGAVLCAAVAAAAQQPADAGCDPRVRDALAAAAEAGVAHDLAVIRHPDQGIRNPEPLSAFSCLERFLDYRRFDVFFDPGDALTSLLRAARRQVCGIAQQAYRRSIGRTLDAGVYTGPAPRLPGLDAVPAPDRPAGDLRPPARIEGAGDAERFRGIVGDGR